MVKARMTNENHKCGKNSKEESKSQNMVKNSKWRVKIINVVKTHKMS